LSTQNTFIIRAKGRMGDCIQIVSMNQSQIFFIYRRMQQYGFIGAVILVALLTSGCFKIMVA
jgi:hypothetical protein